MDQVRRERREIAACRGVHAERDAVVAAPRESSPTGTEMSVPVGSNAGVGLVGEIDADRDALPLEIADEQVQCLVRPVALVIVIAGEKRDAKLVLAHWAASLCYPTFRYGGIMTLVGQRTAGGSAASFRAR